MVHTFFLCWRYLRKRRIVLFPIAAVMLCVALLIVVTSLFDGFLGKYWQYQNRIFGELTLTPPGEMAGYFELADRLEALEEVKAASAVASTGGLLYLGRGDVRGVTILGIDLEAYCRDEAFRAGLVMCDDEQGESPGFALPPDSREHARAWLQRKLRREVSDDDLPVGVVLGIGVFGEPSDATDEYDIDAIHQMLAERQTGMSITTGSMAGGAEGRSVSRRTGACWPVGVVETGLDEADSGFIYLPFDYVAGLIGTGDACIARVQITPATDYQRADVIAKIRQVWREFARSRLGWSEDHIEDVAISSRDEGRWAKLFTHEIEKQLAVMQLILGLICTVVVVLVFVVLFMIVLQKRRDIGIVRSVGSSRLGIAMVFIGYGGVIGFIGAVLGLGLGVLATRNIAVIESVLTKVLGFKVWKSGVYMFRDIPNEVSWQAVWWIMLAGLAAAVVGAMLPAVRAARMQPAAALRYE